MGSGWIGRKVGGVCEVALRAQGGEASAEGLFDGAVGVAAEDDAGGWWGGWGPNPRPADYEPAGLAGVEVL
jgi:hypothetical protein